MARYGGLCSIISKLEKLRLEESFKFKASLGFIGILG